MQSSSFMDYGSLVQRITGPKGAHWSFCEQTQQQQQQQQPCYGPLSGIARWASTRRNIHPLTPILIIKHPLSASSIYYDPQHPHCSILVLDSRFTEPGSRSVLVNLCLEPSTSYSNHCRIFGTRAHTIAICFAVEPRLCHPFLASLSHLFTWNSIFYLNVTHPSDHSHLCSLSATSFSFLTWQVSLPCSNILLRTQLLYSLPVIINDIFFLVSIQAMVPTAWIYSIQLESWPTQLHWFHSHRET